MIINHKHRFVYIRIPRTASGSVTAFLKQLDGSTEEKPYHGFDVPGECRFYYIFTTVRNPYARCWSWWGWEMQRSNEKKTFVEFMRDIIRWRDFGREENREPMSYMTQCQYIEKASINKTLRMEYLLKELEELHFVRRPVSLPNIHTNVCLPDIKCMPPQGIELVNAYCPDDFQILRYRML